MATKKENLIDDGELVELPPKELYEVALDAATDGEPLLIIGPPGTGKSDIVKQVSDKVGKPMLAPINLAHSDSTDMKGMPKLDEGFVIWVKEKRWLIDAPTTVFLDELAQGQVIAMNGAAPIYLEKRVDDVYLHPDTWVVAASNRMSDKAGTNRIPSQFPNRGTTVGVRYDCESQVEWMLTQDSMDMLTLRFLRMLGDTAFSFDPNCLVNPTPRQWSWVARKLERTTHVPYATIAGRITKGHATKLLAFRDLAPTLPSVEEVLLTPTKARVPENTSAQFLVTDMLADQASVNTFDALVEYAQRLPPEMQAKFVKDSLTRKPEVASTKSFVRWGVKFSEVLR